VGHQRRGLLTGAGQLGAVQIFALPVAVGPTVSQTEGMIAIEDEAE